MMHNLKKRYNKLLVEINQQLIQINSYIEAWKFSRPEDALALETKKLTLERTLAFVTQTLESEEQITDPAVIKALDEKLDNVESIMSLLKKDTKSRWLKILQSPITIFIALLMLRSFAFSLEPITSGSNEPTLLIGDNVVINHLAYIKKPIERGDLVLIESPEVDYEKTGTLKHIWQSIFGIKSTLFDLPAKPPKVIKRVIALPGDLIEGRIEDGKAILYLNGKQLLEPYVNPYPLIAFKRKNVSLNPEVMTQRLLAPFFEETDINNEYIWLTYNEKSSQVGPFYKLSDSQMVLHPNSKKPFLKNPGIPIAQDIFYSIELPENAYWCQGDNRRNSKDSRHWGYILRNRIKGKVEKIIYSIDELESDWIFTALKDPIGFFKNHLRVNRFWKTPDST